LNRRPQIDHLKAPSLSLCKENKGEEIDQRRNTCKGRERKKIEKARDRLHGSKKKRRRSQQLKSQHGFGPKQKRKWASKPNYKSPNPMAQLGN
jgi:hypothetical protein